MEEGYPGKLTAVVKYLVRGPVQNFLRHWVNASDIFDRPLSKIFEKILKKILDLRKIETYQGNRLEIIYQARTTMKTVVNLTNHVYFNLDGHKQWNDLSNQTVAIFADKYTPVDETAIPFGEIADVQGRFEITI